jgi:tRNA-specific 2-thiouridylase
MSGGVDSAVAALLLAEAGYEVLGVTLKLFCYGEADAEATERSCCSLGAIDDARRSARAIGARHTVLDFSSEFRRGVLDPFSRAYVAGRTPSPCVACNSDVKFNRFLVKALGLGFDFIATGHYARRGETERGEPALLAGADAAKDQSYFLWGIEREALPRILLPVGHMTKAEVRETARRAGLPVADKPESMDICFVPRGDYGAFLERERALAGGGEVWDAALSPGPIVDAAGRRLGTHRGIARYTVGQRKGLGVAAPRPLYVTAVDAATRTVAVGGDEALLAEGCEADGANFLAPVERGAPLCAASRIRHRHAPVGSTLCALDGGRVRVAFDAPQRAVTPGQSIVFYDGERVVGGATIARAVGRA